MSVGWRGRLRLDYRFEGEGATPDRPARTVAQDRHEGPLRVLKPLYPEGPRICHHIIVHPPGGVVGGDELHIDAQVGSDAHALITTPGATRFYRSDGARAVQAVSLQLAAGARLEWLPMEAIAYSGCRADSRLRAELAPGAEMIGWDVLALGLGAAGQPFEKGWFGQHLELPGVWLDRARIAGDDRSLLDGALGWGGRPVLATSWFAAGTALAPERREAMLQAGRDAIDPLPQGVSAGVTAPQAAVVVLRLLSPGVEPAMQLLARVRQVWRRIAWGLAGNPPRIWRT